MWGEKDVKYMSQLYNHITRTIRTFCVLWPVEPLQYKTVCSVFREKLHNDLHEWTKTGGKYDKNKQAAPKIPPSLLALSEKLHSLLDSET